MGPKTLTGRDEASNLSQKEKMHGRQHRCRKLSEDSTAQVPKVFNRHAQVPKVIRRQHRCQKLSADSTGAQSYGVIEQSRIKVVVFLVFHELAIVGNC